MADYKLLSDHELAVLLRQGDSYAYTEIFERYSRLLIAHAYRLLADQDEANDIVQEVLLTLWQKKESLVFRSSLSAYLFTAIRNRIFNHIAHQKIVARYAGSILDFLESGFAVADERVVEKEMAALIEQEIVALPDRMRQIFLLYKRDELNYREIADQLNISDKTAKQQVYNAVKTLKLKFNSFISILPLFF